MTNRTRPLIDLDQPARLYVGDLLLILRISRPTLYKGLASGRYPAADGHDQKRPYWRTQTIKAFLSDDTPSTDCN